MTRRSGRSDIPDDPAAAMRALGGCRAAMLDVLRAVKPMGPAYHAASMVVAAIDGLASFLTGERYYFSIGGSAPAERAGSPQSGTPGAQLILDMGYPPMVQRAVSHTVLDKAKLLARVKRIRGQVEAIERALEAEAGCDKVLHLIAGVRGATTGLMAEVIEEHVRSHLVDRTKHPGALDEDAAQALLAVVRSYLR